MTFRVDGLAAGSATAGLEEGWSSSFDCLAELVEATQHRSVHFSFPCARFLSRQRADAERHLIHHTVASNERERLPGTDISIEYSGA